MDLVCGKLVVRVVVVTEDPIVTRGYDGRTAISLCFIFKLVMNTSMRLRQCVLTPSVSMLGSIPLRGNKRSACQCRSGLAYIKP
jgi:hypothetical protein